MVAMLMREENAIQLIRSQTALLKAQQQLARAQAAIDQNLAMIGGHQSAVSPAPAAEHRQAEHAG